MRSLLCTGRRGLSGRSEDQRPVDAGSGKPAAATELSSKAQGIPPRRRDSFTRQAGRPRDVSSVRNARDRDQLPGEARSRITDGTILEPRFPGLLRQLHRQRATTLKRAVAMAHRTNAQGQLHSRPGSGSPDQDDPALPGRHRQAIPSSWVAAELPTYPDTRTAVIRRSRSSIRRLEPCLSVRVPARSADRTLGSRNFPVQNSAFNCGME